MELEIPSAEEQPPLLHHPSTQSRRLRQRRPRAGVALPPLHFWCSPKKHQKKISIFPPGNSPSPKLKKSGAVSLLGRVPAPWEGGRNAHPQAGKSSLYLEMGDKEIRSMEEPGQPFGIALGGSSVLPAACGMRTCALQGRESARCCTGTSSTAPSGLSVGARLGRGWCWRCHTLGDTSVSVE